MKTKRDIHGKGKVYAFYALAKKKGLKIERLSVVFPNGTVYLAKNVDDLRRYVEDY